jgi:PAS domain S-box-containing protein
VVGRSDFDFFEEEFARQGRRDEQEVIRTGLPVIGRDYREVWKDGRETWSSVSIVPLRDRHGHVIGTMGIARDITEARRREQRVRQLSRAVEQSPSMVLITDRSGCIEYVNPKFTEVTGYQAEEIRGRNPRLLNSGEHDVSLYRQLWQTITAGHEWRGELLNRKKNGDLHWVRTSVSPIRDSSGEITHFVGVTEDVTQEKKAAAAFEAEQRRRQELERIINISPAIAFRWRAAPGWPVEFVSENVRLWGYAADDLISGRVSYSSHRAPGRPRPGGARGAAERRCGDGRIRPGVPGGLAERRGALAGGPHLGPAR